MLRNRRAFFLELFISAMRARLHVGIEKELELGVGKNRRTYVASFQDYAAVSARRALQLAHPRAHRANRREPRRELADFRIVLQRGHIATVEKYFLAVELYLNPLEYRR